MEEQMKEKFQTTTIMSKYVNKLKIGSMLNDIIRSQHYSVKKISHCHLDSEVILKILNYLIIRQKNNEAESAILQYQIKKGFAILTGFSKPHFDIKNKENSFLFEAVLLAQIINQLIRQLKLVEIEDLSVEAIFITIIFLLTDKFVTPNCYQLLHQKLKTHILPFAKKAVQSSHSSQNQLNIANHHARQAEKFKEQVRSIIRPKVQETSPLKHLHSVGIIPNRFKNKENQFHLAFNRELRKTFHADLHQTRQQKCHSQQSQSVSSVKLARMSTKHRKQYTWSKCELFKSNYIPFCIKKPVVQVKQKVISFNSNKFKLLRQKTIRLEQHDKIILKI